MGTERKILQGMAERSFNAVFGAFGLRCTSGLSTTSGFVVEEMQLGEDNVPFFPIHTPRGERGAHRKLHDWYTKGIIDKEFITGENHGGYTALSHSFMNGQIGLTSAQTYHYFWPQPGYERCQKQGNLPERSCWRVNPEAEVVIGPAPAGPDGKSGTEGWGKVGTLTCLTTNAANDPRKVDAFLAMLDAYYSDRVYGAGKLRN